VIRCVGPLLAIAGVFAAAGCLGRAESRFVPQRVSRDPYAKRTLAQLQHRINHKDARGVCALYLAPSSRCVAIWRNRIRQFPTPVRFSMRRLIFGCAGDARLLFAETSRRGRQLRMLSLASAAPNVYTLIIDVPMGRRRSSLIVPATGTCASNGDHLGGIGADQHDPASTY